METSRRCLLDLFINCNRGLIVGISAIYISSSLSATTVYAASYDCKLAKTKIEKFVCADAVLSKLDENLDKVYKARMKASVTPGVDRAAQRNWQKVTRERCPDRNCLLSVYRNRIWELHQRDAVVDFAASNAPKPAIVRGTDKGMSMYVVEWFDGGGNKLGKPLSVDGLLPGESFKASLLPGADTINDILVWLEPIGLPPGSNSRPIGMVVNRAKGIVGEKTVLSDQNGLIGYARAVRLKDHLAVVWTLVDRNANGKNNNKTAIYMRSFDFDLNPLEPSSTRLFVSKARVTSLGVAPTVDGIVIIWSEYDKKEISTFAWAFDKEGHSIGRTASLAKSRLGEKTNIYGLPVAHQDGTTCVWMSQRRNKNPMLYPKHLDRYAQPTGKDWVCRWRSNLTKNAKDALMEFETSTTRRRQDSAGLSTFKGGTSPVNFAKFYMWGPHKKLIGKSYPAITTVKMSSDQRWIVAGRRKGYVDIWDLTKSAPIRVIQAFPAENMVADIKFTSDNHHILVAAAHADTKKIRLADAKILGDIASDGYYRPGIGISENNQVFIHVGKSILRYDLEGGEYRNITDSLPVTNNTKLVRLSGDGQYVVRADHLGNVDFYQYIEHPDLDRWGIRKIRTVRRGSSATAREIVWRPAGGEIIVAWSDGIIVGYDPNTIQELYRIDSGLDRISIATMTNNGRFLAVIGKRGDGKYAIWKILRVDVPARTSMTIVSERYLHYMNAFLSSDGHFLAVYEMGGGQILELEK